MSIPAHIEDSGHIPVGRGDHADLMTARIPDSSYNLQTGAGSCWGMDEITVTVRTRSHIKPILLVKGIVHHNGSARYRGEPVLSLQFYDKNKKLLATHSRTIQVPCEGDFNLPFSYESEISAEVSPLTLRTVQRQHHTTAAYHCG